MNDHIAPDQTLRFSVLDFMPVGVMLLDPEYRILFWNKYMAFWTKRPSSEVLGKDIRELYPLLSNPKYTSRLDMIFQGGPPHIFSSHLHKRLVPFHLHDGSLALQHVTVSGLKREGGKGFDALFTIQDVTEVQRRLNDYSAMRDVAMKELAERRKFEESLALKNSILEATLDNIGQGVVMTDEAGTVINYNRTLLEMFSLPADFFDTHPQIRDFFNVVAGFEKTHQPLEWAGIKRLTLFEITGFEGRSMEVRHNPLPDGGLIQVYTDVSERKRLEKIKEDVDRLARHDLKNPLVGIINLPDSIMHDENLLPEQREVIRQIKDSGLRMLKMINLSLILYKMEIGSYRVIARPLNLVSIINGIFRDMVSMLEFRGLKPVITIEGNKINLESASFYIRADDTPCYAMLANLIANAVEAAEPETEIRIELSSDDENSHISIHNSGVIPEEIRDSFFEKYATYGKPGGTGLGTYSSRLIARAHGGDISFTTSDTDGTILVVTLPRNQPSFSIINEG